MIVRLMNEGQYKTDEDVLRGSTRSGRPGRGGARGRDEPTLDARLDDMRRLVQERGERLPDDDLSTSDLIIPPADLTLEETRELFSDEGLIPDLPAA